MKFAGKYTCPVEAALDLIGGKYKALILWHLIDKTLRFHEISKLIPRATPKRDGFIVRAVYPVVPPKVEYSLTDLGKSIIPVLAAMCRWGERYLDGLDPSPCSR